MKQNLTQALNRVVLIFTQDALEDESRCINQLLSLSFNLYLEKVCRRLKLLAEASGRNTVISLDFHTFVPEISIQIASHQRLLNVPQGIMTSSCNEYKRCAPPPEHAYRFSKTKGLRMDDLFSVRKRKTHQTQQIEASLMKVIQQGNFNYDA